MTRSESGDKSGYTECKRDSEGIQKAYVTIFEDFKFAKNPRARLRHYLGVLVHEMLHAVLCLYCCRCDNCNPEQSLDGDGETGHGLLWLKAAKNIEFFLDSTLYLELSLSRAMSLAYELWESKQELKSVHLDQIGLLKDKVEDLLQYYQGHRRNPYSEYESDCRYLDYDTDYEYEIGKKRKRLS